MFQICSKNFFWLKIAKIANTTTTNANKTIKAIQKEKTTTLKSII